MDVGLLILVFLGLVTLFALASMAGIFGVMSLGWRALATMADRDRVRRQDHAAKVAANLGLALTRWGKNTWFATLEGTFQGRAVRVQQIGRAGPNGPPRIRFTLGGVQTPLTLPADTRRHTGDSRLDALVPINGPPVSVHGLLDPDTRQHLVELCSHGALEVANGAIRYTRGLAFTSAVVHAQLEALSWLADRLSRPDRSPEEMLADLEGEPDASVRLTVALALGWDRAPEVQAALCALLQTGSEDEQTLAALLRQDVEAVTPERADSLRRLAEQEPAWIIALILALPRPEEGLVLLLYGAHDAVVRGAIAALAEHGASSALQHLRPLATGLLTPAAVRREAQLASERIRGRLVHAEPGTLSLLEAEPNEGALSLTDRAQGRLSEAIK